MKQINKVTIKPDPNDHSKVVTLKKKAKRIPKVQMADDQDYRFILSLPAWIPVQGNFVRPGFKDAAHFICEMEEQGETNWRLVHGIIWMRKGRYVSWFIHAWCEKGDLVVDRIREIQTSRSEYYKTHKIEGEQISYSLAEAKELMVDKYSYGPWDEGLKALIKSGAMEAGITG